MIDRLFAMWQVLYPDSYLEPQAQGSSSYWYAQGDVLDVNTGLKPFHSDTNGNFHTSASVRNLTTFGYTYTDMASGNPADVRSAINRLYGDLTETANRKRYVDSSKVAHKNITELATDPRVYIVNIKANKGTEHGSYLVRIFLGDFTPDPMGWGRDPNLVGTHTVFSKQMSQGIAPISVSGVVMLNKALEKAHAAGDLHSLSPEVVAPYLRKNLHWRIEKVSRVCTESSVLNHS